MSFSNRQRELKIHYIKQMLKENEKETLDVIIAKMHHKLSKRIAKEYLEAMHINGEIKIYEEPKGTYRVKVLK